MKLDAAMLRKLPLALRVQIEENAQRKPLTQSELAAEQRRILAVLRKYKEPGRRIDRDSTSTPEKAFSEVRATANVGKLYGESHKQLEKRLAVVDAAEAVLAIFTLVRQSPGERPPRTSSIRITAGRVASCPERWAFFACKITARVRRAPARANEPHGPCAWKRDTVSPPCCRNRHATDQCRRSRDLGTGYSIGSGRCRRQIPRGEHNVIIRRRRTAARPSRIQWPAKPRRRRRP